MAKCYILILKLPLTINGSFKLFSVHTENLKTENDTSNVLLGSNCYYNLDVKQTKTLEKKYIR